MKNKWKILSLIFIIVLCAILFASILFVWGDTLGYDSWGQKLAIWLQAMLLLLGLLLTPIIITNSRKIWAKEKAKQESLNPAETKEQKKVVPFAEFLDIKKQCKYRFGLFWRYKTRKCLVMGNSSDVANLFPNLTHEQWQLCENTIIIYGGDIQDELNTPWFLALKKHFSRLVPLFHKPIDAVIWVQSEYYLAKNRQQQLLAEKAILQLQARNRVLNWSAPLYLVSAKESEWVQSGRVEQSVGLLFTRLKKDTQTLDSLTVSLDQLAAECSFRGVHQVKKNIRYDFLLKLSQDLVKRDIVNIKRYITSLVSFPNPPRVRGIFFTPYSSATDDEQLLSEHYLLMTPTWQTISDDAKMQLGQRMGIKWGMIACCCLLVVMMVMGLGLITSYFRNASLIEESIALVKQADDSATKDYTTRLQRQDQLQQRLEQLLYRQRQGTPWTYRFGLNHNDPLLSKLWLSYRVTCSRNMATPFYDMLTNKLNTLVDMSPDNPERIKLLDSAYDILKAYLMMSHPDKSDGDYLSQFATQKWPTPKGISDGDWQKFMPGLIRFWGEMLNLHPDWAEKNDARLTKDVRQILIGQIGVQNAVNTLYQELIQRASQHYANQNLNLLLEGLDSRLLFSSDIDVPGVYTRKAWEDSIKDDIEEAAKSRQEQIDWVLSDGENTLTASISPTVLKQQLTERYFSEYSAAWLYFLNTIKWHQADNVSDVIEQLTLLADTRQSPLIALMNVVKYQSEVAYKGDGLSDNFIRSAQELIGNKSKTGLPKNNQPSGPLTQTFAPLTSLLKNDNTNGLSLQTYLLRVTQVRLKLQNIANSADPQAMMQVLAKSVFKGSSVDLTETRDYGNLIAANLGEEWSGFGYSLFKRPLEQSWQVVLAPASMSFNDLWQTYIVSQWEKSFAGRYPFKNSDNEASLAELARFLRADTGLIDRFIINELSGVLEKKGGNWVVNNVKAQGLNFSPKFLEALTLFSDLSTELLPSGDVSLSFDLMPRSGSQIARTELVVNKQKLVYFNQAPIWQRFNWPGDGYSPYSQLSWSGDNTGLRLYAYYSGDWAWIRLLESASIKQIDSSRYDVVWKTPDERKLRFILRTQLGGGPLTLLKLRNFTLPKTVFE